MVANQRYEGEVPFLDGGYTELAPLGIVGRAVTSPSFLDVIDFELAKSIAGKQRAKKLAIDSVPEPVKETHIFEVLPVPPIQAEVFVINPGQDPKIDPNSLEILAFHNSHEDDLMDFEEKLDGAMSKPGFCRSNRDEDVSQCIFDMISEGDSVFTPGPDGQATFDYAKIAQLTGVDIDEVIDFIDRVGYKIPQPDHLPITTEKESSKPINKNKYELLIEDIELVIQEDPNISDKQKETLRAYIAMLGQGHFRFRRSERLVSSQKIADAVNGYPASVRRLIGSIPTRASTIRQDGRF